MAGLFSVFYNIEHSESGGRKETALIPNASAIIIRLRISGMVESDSQALTEKFLLAPMTR